MKIRSLGTVLVASVAITAAHVAHDSLDAEGPYLAPAFSLMGAGSAGFTSSGVSLAGWVTLADIDMSLTSGNDCWGYVSGSGREYAIIGTSGGTAFVEITDPGAPSLLTHLTGPTSLWRDIKVYQDYAYAVSEGGGGIQVFDMSSIDSGTVTVGTPVTGTGCTDASHNVAIDETSGYLYRVGGSGSPCAGAPQGLVIYDLSTPSAPTFVTTWTTKYVHDVQVITWPHAGPHFGKELAFAAAEDGSGGGNPALYILDVSNKGAISVLGSATYASSAYSHQVWVSDDGQYAYLNDELDEQSFGGTTNSRVFDLSDLTAPFVTSTFSSGSSSIDHNLYVKGNQLFEANYRSGLRVFDLTSPTAPVQTAWFDTYPADDDAEFNSLWSCYPFFPSGTVIGSDLEKGLFVWRLGDPELTFSFPDGEPDLIDPSGGTPLLVQLTENLPGDLQSGTVQFHVDTGSGFTTVGLDAIAGSFLYETTFPAANCGDTVRYYLSASSTNGITWTSPAAGPTQIHTTTAALYNTLISTDDVEVDLGWTVGQIGDTATTGIWTRVDPVGTAAQPEDDHTDPGFFAWVTGQGSPGGGLGVNDVDGGVTTLISPTIDASGLLDPYISYWRWHSNNQSSNPGQDAMRVDISDDNGSTWTSLEVVGPSGPDAIGGWIQHSARIADFVTPTNQLRLRFQSEDLNGGSIVESGVDDIQVTDFVCTLAVSSLSPMKGSFRGGNKVVILGEGFVSGVTTVAFDGRPSPSVMVTSPTRLVAEVPPARRKGKRMRSPTPVNVTVKTGPGSVTEVGAYTYEVTLKSL